MNNNSNIRTSNNEIGIRCKIFTFFAVSVLWLIISFECQKLRLTNTGFFKDDADINYFDISLTNMWCQFWGADFFLNNI